MTIADHRLPLIGLATLAVGLVLSLSVYAQPPQGKTQPPQGKTQPPQGKTQPPRSRTRPSASETRPGQASDQPSSSKNSAQSTAAATWLDRRQLDRALNQPLKITLQDVPVREALRRLSAATRVAIWLDRRIDPSQAINLQPSDLSLAQTLSAIGQQIDAGVGRVGPVIYVGPRATAESLATRAALLEDYVSKLPKVERGQWGAEKRISWPYATAVSEIWRQATADGPRSLSELSNSPELPHDLWPDQSLPPLRMGELLTLILSGFDLHLDPQPDGTWQLVANGAEPPAIAREYEIPAALEPALQQLAQQHTRATTQRRGSTVAVRGPWEMHDALRRLLQDERRPRGEPNNPNDARTGNRPSGGGQPGGGEPSTGRASRRRESAPEVRLQFRVQDQPLRAVLRYLEEHQQLTFEVPDALTSELDQRVTLEVNNATLDEVLRQLAEASHTRMSRSGQTVRLAPAKPQNQP